jgi:hypothetical protein
MRNLIFAGATVLLCASCNNDCDIAEETRAYTETSIFHLGTDRVEFRFIQDDSSYIKLNGPTGNIFKIAISGNDYLPYWASHNILWITHLSNGLPCNELSICEIHAPKITGLLLGSQVSPGVIPLPDFSYELDYEYVFFQEPVVTDSLTIYNNLNANFSIESYTNYMKISGYMDSGNLFSGSTHYLEIVTDFEPAKTLFASHLVADTLVIKASEKDTVISPDIFHVHADQLLVISGEGVYEDSAVIINYTGHPVIDNQLPAGVVVLNDVN